MKLIRRFQKFLEVMKDHKLNRELVGMDKYGNKYYQFYSSFGLPTRREIEPVQKKRFQFFEDHAFFFWLRNYNQLPPTPQELKEYYLKEEERRIKALEWDKKEQQFILEFRNKRKIVEDKWKKVDALPENEKFEPETWKPNFTKKPMNEDQLFEKPK